VALAFQEETAIEFALGNVNPQSVHEILLFQKEKMPTCPLALCMQGRTLGYRSVSSLARKGEERLDLHNKVDAFRGAPSSFPPM
jgi:hypothetical protein